MYLVLTAGEEQFDASLYCCGNNRASSWPSQQLFTRMLLVAFNSLNEIEHNCTIEILPGIEPMYVIWLLSNVFCRFAIEFIIFLVHSALGPGFSFFHDILIDGIWLCFQNGDNEPENGQCKHDRQSTTKVDDVHRINSSCICAITRRTPSQFSSLKIRRSANFI